VPLVAVHFLSFVHSKEMMYSPKQWLDRRILSGIGCFFVSFLIGSPGLILALNSFFSAFLFEREHMNVGHLGSFGIPYMRLLRLFWKWESGFAILYGLGCIYALMRHQKKHLILLSIVFSLF